MSATQKAYISKMMAVLTGASGPCVFMTVITVLSFWVGVMYFLIFGAVIVLTISFVMERNEYSIKSFWHEIILHRKLMIFLLIASLCESCLYVFFGMAMRMKTVTETVIAIRVAPLFSIMLAVTLLGERVKSKLGVFLAFALCFAGMGLTSGENLVINRFTFVTLGAAFLMSLSTVLQRKIITEYQVSKGMLTGMVMLFGAVMMFIWSWLIHASFDIPDLKTFGLLVYLGVVTVGIPVFLGLLAFELIGSLSKLAFFDYLIPIFGSLYAFLWNGEVGFNYGKLVIGFVLVTIGIYIANRSVDLSPQKEGQNGN